MVEKLFKREMFRKQIINPFLILVCFLINNFCLSNSTRSSKVRRQLDLNENLVEDSVSNNEKIYPLPTVANVKRYTDQFNKCQRGTLDYNDCVANALNYAIKYFRTGVPELKMPVMEPIYIKHASASQTIGPIQIKLKFINITETGWSKLRIANFKGDGYPREFYIELDFQGPKSTVADYEFESPLLNINRIRGKLNIFMDGIAGSITFRRLKDNSIRSDCDISKLEVLRMFATIPGNPILENLVNSYITSLWKPTFQIMHQFINDILTSGSSEFSNRAGDNFIFNKLLPISSSQ